MGGLLVEVIEAIGLARILGYLLTYRFTRRLVNKLFIILTREEDKISRYKLYFLDAYLIDIKTRFEDLN